MRELFQLAFVSKVQEKEHKRFYGSNHHRLQTMQTPRSSHKITSTIVKHTQANRPTHKRSDHNIAVIDVPSTQASTHTTSHGVDINIRGATMFETTLRHQ